MDDDIWDPGRAPAPSQHVCVKMSAAICADVNDGNAGELESRTHLDSHANMPVVGRNVMSLFASDKMAMKEKMVNAAICYNCVCSIHKKYLDSTI